MNIMNFNLIDTYRRITITNYKKYCKVKSELKTVNNISCLALGPDKELFQDTLWSKEYEYGVTIIIFSVFTIEAFCNDYIRTSLGKNYMEQLDKLDIKNKLLVAVRLVTGNDFPKDNKSYFYLKNLISLRNKLVHSKSKIIDLEELEGLEEEELLKRINNFYIKIDERIIHEAIELYNLLMDDIKTLDKKLNKKYLITDDNIVEHFYNDL